AFGAVEAGPEQHGDQITTGRQQQIDQADRRRADIAGHDQHLVTGDAQSVTGPTGSGPRQRLLGGDPTRTVPGGPRHPRHGVAVAPTSPATISTSSPAMPSPSPGRQAPAQVSACSVATRTEPCRVVPATRAMV